MAEPEKKEPSEEEKSKKEWEGAKKEFRDALRERFQAFEDADVAEGMDEATGAAKKHSLDPFGGEDWEGSVGHIPSPATPRKGETYDQFIDRRVREKLANDPDALKAYEGAPLDAQGNIIKPPTPIASGPPSTPTLIGTPPQAQPTGQGGVTVNPTGGQPGLAQNVAGQAANLAETTQTGIGSPELRQRSGEIGTAGKHALGAMEAEQPQVQKLKDEVQEIRDTDAIMAGAEEAAQRKLREHIQKGSQARLDEMDSLRQRYLDAAKIDPDRLWKRPAQGKDVYGSVTAGSLRLPFDVGYKRDNPVRERMLEEIAQDAASRKLKEGVIDPFSPQDDVAFREGRKGFYEAGGRVRPEGPVTIDVPGNESFFGGKKVTIDEHGDTTRNGPKRSALESSPGPVSKATGYGKDDARRRFATLKLEEETPESTDWPRKALGLIGLAMSTFGASATRTPNYGLDIINKAIDRDIDSQRAGLDRITKAHEIARSDYANFLQKGRDDELATNQSRLLRNEWVLSQLNAAAARFDQATVPQALQQMIAQKQMDVSKIRADIDAKQGQLDEARFKTLLPFAYADVRQRMANETLLNFKPIAVNDVTDPESRRRLELVISARYQDKKQREEAMKQLDTVSAVETTRKAYKDIFNQYRTKLQEARNGLLPSYQLQKDRATLYREYQAITGKMVDKGIRNPQLLDAIGKLGPGAGGSLGVHIPHLGIDIRPFPEGTGDNMSDLLEKERAIDKLLDVLGHSSMLEDAGLIIKPERH